MISEINEQNIIEKDINTQKNEHLIAQVDLLVRFSWNKITMKKIRSHQWSTPIVQMWTSASQKVLYLNIMFLYKDWAPKVTGPTQPDS